MKTKITTLLMVSIFFLSAVAFAADPPPNPKTVPVHIYIGPPSVIDYLKSILYRFQIDFTLPPWWIGPPEVNSELPE